MITGITSPKWILSRREWEITYTVNDATIGEYKQRIWAETLVAAERVIQCIKEKLKQENCRL